MSAPRTFVGFGFGAIQSGLFLAEAFVSGRFDRLVVAEVNPARVQALRANNGCFAVNVAKADRRDTVMIEGVEIYNPTKPEDAQKLIDALTDAHEIATALPSIDFYERGEPAVATLLRKALRRKHEDDTRPPAIVYTAENHNHAAERLEECIFASGAAKPARMQLLNTVIGKMSSVVTDRAAIQRLQLEPFVPGAHEAFLVESFNRILISRIQSPGFERGITVFEEKEDLLPFEEAKLYGHNAIHALLGYLAHERNVPEMSGLRDHPHLVELGRRAFLDECGAALVKKYAGLDPLFTPQGFHAYADDLLERMLNPWLRDPVDRIIRDPLRKLGWNDRLIGAMRLAVSQQVTPQILACGARAAIAHIPDKDPFARLQIVWEEEGADRHEQEAVLDLLKREG